MEYIAYNDTMEHETEGNLSKKELRRRHSVEAATFLQKLHLKTSKRPSVSNKRSSLDHVRQGTSPESAKEAVDEAMKHAMSQARKASMSEPISPEQGGMDLAPNCKPEGDSLPPVYRPIKRPVNRSDGREVLRSNSQPMPPVPHSSEKPSQRLNGEIAPSFNSSNDSRTNSSSSNSSKPSKSADYGRRHSIEAGFLHQLHLNAAKDPRKMEKPSSDHKTYDSDSDTFDTASYVDAIHRQDHNFTKVEENQDSDSDASLNHEVIGRSKSIGSSNFHSQSTTFRKFWSDKIREYSEAHGVSVASLSSTVASTNFSSSESNLENVDAMGAMDEMMSMECLLMRQDSHDILRDVGDSIEDDSFFNGKQEEVDDFLFPKKSSTGVVKSRGKETKAMNGSVTSSSLNSSTPSLLSTTSESSFTMSGLNNNLSGMSLNHEDIGIVDEDEECDVTAHDAKIMEQVRRELHQRDPMSRKLRRRLSNSDPNFYESDMRKHRSKSKHDEHNVSAPHLNWEGKGSTKQHRSRSKNDEYNVSAPNLAWDGKSSSNASKPLKKFEAQRRCASCHNEGYDDKEAVEPKKKRSESRRRRATVLGKSPAQKLKPPPAVSHAIPSARRRRATVNMKSPPTVPASTPSSSKEPSSQPTSKDSSATRRRRATVYGNSPQPYSKSRSKSSSRPANEESTQPENISQPAQSTVHQQVALPKPSAQTSIKDSSTSRRRRATVYGNPPDPSSKSKAAKDQNAQESQASKTEDTAQPRRRRATVIGRSPPPVKKPVKPKPSAKSGRRRATVYGNSPHPPPPSHSASEQPSSQSPQCEEPKKRFQRRRASCCDIADSKSITSMIYSNELKDLISDMVAVSDSSTSGARRQARRSSHCDIAGSFTSRKGNESIISSGSVMSREGQQQKDAQVEVVQKVEKNGNYSQETQESESEDSCFTYTTIKNVQNSTHADEIIRHLKEHMAYLDERTKKSKSFRCGTSSLKLSKEQSMQGDTAATSNASKTAVPSKTVTSTGSGADSATSSLFVNNSCCPGEPHKPQKSQNGQNGMDVGANCSLPICVVECSKSKDSGKGTYSSKPPTSSEEKERDDCFGRRRDPPTFSRKASQGMTLKPIKSTEKRPQDPPPEFARKSTQNHSLSHPSGRQEASKQAENKLMSKPSKNGRTASRGRPVKAERAKQEISKEKQQRRSKSRPKEILNDPVSKERFQSKASRGTTKDAKPSIEKPTKTTSKPPSSKQNKLFSKPSNGFRRLNSADSAKVHPISSTPTTTRDRSREQLMNTNAKMTRDAPANIERKQQQKIEEIDLVDTKVSAHSSKFRRVRSMECMMEKAKEQKMNPFAFF